MRHIVFAAILGLGALLGLSAGVHAAQPYNAGAFQQAQKAGKTVLLHVTAPWCSTCRAQHPVIASIKKAKPKLVVYTIDYDSSKDLLRQLRVQSQSTLIVFKGANETGRIVGDSQRDSIASLLDKAL